MVDWRNNTPLSLQFDDIYFQPGQGLAESRHVFLAGNSLPERWQGKKNFSIAELGFGTGLNFLATWEAWLKQPAKSALHYVSIEMFPLTKLEIKRAHQDFNDIAALSNRMLAHYPSCFDQDWTVQIDDNAFLSVLWGSAENRMADIQEKIDAWYLDGFTPAKNPELWADSIFQMMAQKSHPHATFATFTVARTVRDHAEQAGFVLEKRKGFGKKRDMLTGLYSG